MGNDAGRVDFFIFEFFQRITLYQENILKTWRNLEKWNQIIVKFPESLRKLKGLIDFQKSTRRQKSIWRSYEKLGKNQWKFAAPMMFGQILESLQESLKLENAQWDCVFASALIKKLL